MDSSGNPIERIPIIPKKIEPLNLKELSILRRAKSISGQGVYPSVDAGYVLAIVEKLEFKMNEVIDRANEPDECTHNRSNEADEDIVEISKKLNQVIEVLNRNSENMYKELLRFSPSKGKIEKIDTKNE